MDALVAQPFGVQSEQKLSNTDYVHALADQILTELTEALNTYHQVEHNERYWNIVLGHWLKRYVCVVFNRYYTLDQALKNYEVTGAAIFKDADYDLATSDSINFVYACDDDKWNYAIYSRIMTFRGDVEFNQVPTPLGWVEGFYGDRKVANWRFQGIADWAVKKLALTIASLCSKFYSDADAFIICSYLPIKEEIKLQLALGQVPQLWRSPLVKQIKAGSGQRASLKLNYDHFEGFEEYVRWQLPEVIPTCYLEGHEGLIKVAKK
jgi:putative transferase (TIGR04331 family)